MRYLVWFVGAVAIAAGCGGDSDPRDIHPLLAFDSHAKDSPRKDSLDGFTVMLEVPDPAPDVETVAGSDSGTEGVCDRPCTDLNRTEGCQRWTCDPNGCLVLGAGSLPSGTPCNRPEACLRACEAWTDADPGCGICRPSTADTGLLECVSASIEARDEGDGDGCLGESCQRAECRPSDSGWACAEERVPATDGAACLDDDPCTMADTCLSGICRAGIPLNCDDGNACTIDACVPAGNQSGCIHEIRPGQACDDGDTCTVEDRCNPDGVCQGHAMGCDDGNACTTDLCLSEAGGVATCHHEVTAGACDDGDPCTTGDDCGAGGTCAGTGVTCPPGPECVTIAPVASTPTHCECRLEIVGDHCLVRHADGTTACLDVGQTLGCYRCNAAGDTGLVFLAGTPCSDGDDCTTGDSCDPTFLRCRGTPVLVDGKPSTCQVPACDGQKHLVPLVTAPGWCESGGSCLAAGQEAGPCAFCLVEDPSKAGRIVNRSLGFPCSDNRLDTWGDACNAGGKCQGTPYSCAKPELAACTTSAPLGDGTCGSPVLVSSSHCLVGNRCILDGLSPPDEPCLRCDVSTDPFHLVPVPAGETCPASSCCYLNNCDGSGLCVVVAQTTCEDHNPCTADFCEPESCTSASAAPACVHEVFQQPIDCLLSDGSTGYCHQGTCRSKSLCSEVGACDDGDSCTLDSCDSKTGICVHAPDEGAPCNDGNPCTTLDRCTGGACSGAPVECAQPASWTCLAAGCDAGTGLCVTMPLPDGSPCTDHDGCTADSCQGGICVGYGACGVHGAFSGNQLVSVLGAPGTASRTLFANVRFESLATDQVVAGQYGLDPEGRESGVELLVAGLMGSLAGLCELPTGKLAGRLVVRVTASGNDYLFTCTDKCAPPSGSWTLVAAEVGPAGISIFSGFDKAKNVVQCGGPPVPGPLALFEGLATVTVGGRLGPDGKVIQGLHGRITDLVVASGALPSSAPYSPMNLLCLHLQELDCSPTPPPGALVVLRFLSDSHGLIEEAGHLQVLNGLQDGPDTADVLLESGPETFRGHCPVPRNP